MLIRPRVCSAILQGDQILMVYHNHGNRAFWTLPGGGLEEGETLEEALLREVREEVQLEGEVVRQLFEGTYEHGPLYCFLVHTDDVSGARLGLDPELPPTEQVLQGMKWFPSYEMREDLQVKEVLEAL